MANKHAQKAAEYILGALTLADVDMSEFEDLNVYQTVQKGSQIDTTLSIAEGLLALVEEQEKANQLAYEQLQEMKKANILRQRALDKPRY